MRSLNLSELVIHLEVYIMQEQKTRSLPLLIPSEKKSECSPYRNVPKKHSSLSKSGNPNDLSNTFLLSSLHDLNPIQEMSKLQWSIEIRLSALTRSLEIFRCWCGVTVDWRLRSKRTGKRTPVTSRAQYHPSPSFKEAREH